MKDFGQWFAEQKPAPLSLEEQIERLEEIGFEADEYEDGLRVMAECRVCGHKFELTQYVTVKEIIAGEDPTDQYCGSGPRCCP